MTILYYSSFPEVGRKEPGQTGRGVCTEEVQQSLLHGIFSRIERPAGRRLLNRVFGVVLRGIAIALPPRRGTSFAERLLLSAFDSPDPEFELS